MPEYDSTITFRDVPNFPGYKVGSDGTVWSSRQRGYGAGRIKPWEQLNPEVTRRGYLRVVLNKHGRHRRQVHQLVLLAFVGPCPDGMVVRHFPDRNPANNCLENLSWSTQKVNLADRIIHGTAPRGERNNLAKLTADDVRAIRAGRSEGRSCPSLAKEYGVTLQAIALIVRRVNWNYLV